MLHFIKSLPTVWQALTALGAAFVAGSVLLGATLRRDIGAIQLDVHEIEQHDARVAERLKKVEDNYEKLLCLQLAELEGTAWQRCLQ